MLLMLLILIPFIFGFLAWQSEQIKLFMPQRIALCGTSVVFFLSLLLCLWNIEYIHVIYNQSLEIHLSSMWKLEYVHDWIPRFGINFHLALDGLSLLMLLLSSFLGVISILSSWNNINRYQGLFYGNLLWILGGVIGVFLSVDMFFFFFFWEIILIPTYFLISIWGLEDFQNNPRVYAAKQFFIYAQLSGLSMLIVILTLVCCNYDIKGVWSFDYEDLLNIVLPKNTEYLLMLGFFLAFAIKMPIIPFHAWLPEVHSYSPIVCSVELIGILLKTSIYGFFRFILPLFPSASKDFAFIAMILGILNIFYGAWMAFVQTDMKRFIAYSNISHMGFALIAIYSNNQLAYQGAIVQMIACSLSASGLFILCGQLYERLYTKNMINMGGLWNSINLMPAFSLCFVVAMLGLPGTGNFVGEVIILIGTFQTAPIITVAAALGILFTSVYSLVFMQRIYYGVSSINNRLVLCMTFREKFISITLLLCIFVIGLFPQFILDMSYETMQKIYVQLQQCD